MDRVIIMHIRSTFAVLMTQCGGLLRTEAFSFGPEKEVTVCGQKVAVLPLKCLKPKEEKHHPGFAALRLKYQE